MPELLGGSVDMTVTLRPADPSFSSVNPQRPAPSGEDQNFRLIHRENLLLAQSTQEAAYHKVACLWLIQGSLVTSQCGIEAAGLLTGAS